MCVVSMVGDHYTKTIPSWPYFPSQQPWEVDQIRPSKVKPMPERLKNAFTREEFDALKREVEEMKELIKRAKEYDEKNNEPDCEIEEKMELLRKVAALVGVSLDDVVGKAS